MRCSLRQAVSCCKGLDAVAAMCFQEHEPEHGMLPCSMQYEDYKRDLRLRLRAMADTESAAPGQPELLFV